MSALEWAIAGGYAIAAFAVFACLHRWTRPRAEQSRAERRELLHRARALQEHDP